MEQQHVEDVYEIGKELGVGTYSFVHLGTHKDSKKEYAIKIVDKTLMSYKERECLQFEVEILRICDHPNIISLKDTFDSKNRFYIVTEAMYGGDLFDRIVQKKKYSENEGKIVMSHILKAVLYLHQKGLVHRDLKPENMLLLYKEDCTFVKIADFGYSKFINENEYLTALCGTPGYIAPEIANHQPYTKSVDMWSVGVILYTLLAGFPPFYSEDDEELLEKIGVGKFYFPNPYWKNISDDAKDLIKKLLEKDPVKRYTALQALEHPWISGCNASRPTSVDDVRNRTKVKEGINNDNNRPEAVRNKRSPSPSKEEN